jgi:hypothetical protein
MDGGRVHTQPLWERMFARDHYIHVISTAQAVIEDRQKAVGVRRQINPHDARLFIDYMIKKTGILVREAIVILLPDM